MYAKLIEIFDRQPVANEENGARSLAGFIGAVLHVGFLLANPRYYVDWEAAGEVDVDHLVPVTEAATKLLEHRAPLTLMRRCRARLHEEVHVAKAVYREKESRLQHARTRERNYAIEAAGALKRGGNKHGGDDEDEPRRPLRHQEKIDAQKAKERTASDPAELRAEVLNRQALLDEFSRVLKRKQADLVLLEKELEPMTAQEEAAKAAAREASGVTEAGADDDYDAAKAAAAAKAAGKASAGVKKGGGAPTRKGTPPPSKRAGEGGAMPANTTKRAAKPAMGTATKRVAVK